MSAAAPACDAAKLREVVDHATSLPKIQAEVIAALKECDLVPHGSGGKQEKGKEGKEKKKKGGNARSEFMSVCLRSKEKGGQGKSMSECSDAWKKDHPKKEGK
jgi:hypothetical protein